MTLTLATLRRVAFVDMLRGPAHRTYGGCDYVFLLRDRNGAVVAIIDGNTRASRWGGPSSLVSDIASVTGREPRGCQILDIETNGAVKEYARRYPNAGALLSQPARWLASYDATGQRTYVRTSRGN